MAQAHNTTMAGPLKCLVCKNVINSSSVESRCTFCFVTAMSIRSLGEPIWRDPATVEQLSRNFAVDASVSATADSTFSPVKKDHFRQYLKLLGNLDDTVNPMTVDSFEYKAIKAMYSDDAINADHRLPMAPINLEVRH